MLLINASIKAVFLELLPCVRSSFTLFVFRDDCRLPAAILCFLIFGFWMLDKGDLPRAITAWNYLNRTWSLIPE